MGGDDGGAQALGGDTAEVFAGRGIHLVLHSGHIFVAAFPGDGGVGPLFRLEFGADRGRIHCANLADAQLQLRKVRISSILFQH